MKARALILLGSPGSGKGTQARELSKKCRLPHISTGEMLRAAVQKQTPLGQQAKAIMEAGELVPDELVCGIVKERIAEPDCQNGFILDGFPRTIAQAECLDCWIAEDGRGAPTVLDIRVDTETLVRRTVGRLTCPVCGEIYNVFYRPPREDELCDTHGVKLVRRADDNEETFRQRLLAYQTLTMPLIEHYRRLGELVEVDGDGEPAAITERLFKLLGEC